MKKVTYKLHTIMGERRLKLVDVARMAGVDYQTVWRLYHGKCHMISLKTLERLCAALNCNVEDLIRYEEVS